MSSEGFRLPHGFAGKRALKSISNTTLLKAL
jgi:hypothetical protein